MKKIVFCSIAFATMLIACNASKKSTTTTASSTEVKPASSSTTPSVFLMPANGIFIPNDKDLFAIQAKYSAVTMQTLTEGHDLYVGTCTRCHEANAIYPIPEEKWEGIIDDMAPKADLDAKQKDAVYKYVLAMKATQPK